MFARIGGRLLPFLFLLYLINYIDRVNVNVASLPMYHDLGSHGFTEKVFGFGSGIFFIGYALFGIPSNLMLEKFGPRAWVCFIMLIWGVISSAMMFVAGPISYCSLRLALGVAMAGFFPGMILYLTYWFPAARRARAVATFMTASAIAGVLGGPISAMLLRMDGIAHLAGWQWVFLVEGIPPILLAFVVYYVLPNRPDEAKWLAEADRARVDELLAADARSGGAKQSTSLLSAVTDGRVWLLVAVYFCISVGMYCVAFWLPKMIKQAWPGHADWQVSLMTAIPFGAAAVGMVAIGRHSDHTAERRFHAAGSLLLGAAGAIAATLLAAHPLPCIAALCVAATGVWGAFGPFWAMPSAFLGGTAAAGGIALINCLGGLGGFAGPALIGWLKQHFGGFTAGLLMMAAVLTAGAILAMFVNLPKRAAEPQRGFEVAAANT